MQLNFPRFTRRIQNEVSDIHVHKVSDIPVHEVSDIPVQDE